MAQHTNNCRRLLRCQHLSLSSCDEGEASKVNGVLRSLQAKRHCIATYCSCTCIHQSRRFIVHRYCKSIIRSPVRSLQLIIFDGHVSRRKTAKHCFKFLTFRSTVQQTVDFPSTANENKMRTKQELSIMTIDSRPERHPLLSTDG